MVCKYCFKSNPDDGQFCSYCGRPLSGEPFGMTYQDAADFLGCTADDINLLVICGVLRGYKSGRGIKEFVTRESLLQFCRVVPDAKERLKISNKLEQSYKEWKDRSDREETLYHVSSSILSLHRIEDFYVPFIKMFLTPREYKVVCENIIHYKSFKEIAEELGTSASSIKSTRDRAIRVIGQRVMENGESFSQSLKKGTN